MMLYTYITHLLLAFRPIVCSFLVIFFFNDTATTEIYTLSLHDALPIYRDLWRVAAQQPLGAIDPLPDRERSEEHTSELQSPDHLVCRLLLEKKNIRQRVLDYPSPLIDCLHFHPGREGTAVTPDRRRQSL